MKTVFIINPAAGKGKNIENLIEKIEGTAEELGFDVDLYITKSVGDAENYVREYCRKNGAARFIACGGDGTLGEVVNGAIEYQDSEVGVYPIGTGNDFRRNFRNMEAFNDIEAQLSGIGTKCDVIRYSTILDNSEKTGCCVNMFNIGFDCNVADMTAAMKKKPFISGSLAYLLSVFVMLVKKKGERLKIELDGALMHNGRLLLTSVANGMFCGGGIKSNPLASVQDGLININIIYDISRLNFLTKFPFYAKGTHIKLKNIEKIIYTTKCKKAVITPLNGKMRLCADGEIFDAGKTEFEIVPDAINFVLPQKTSDKAAEIIYGKK